MGRGDKRTAKGKRFKGSYGNSRPQKEAVSTAPKAAAKAKPAKKAKDGEKEVTAKKAPPRKAPAKKAE
jgi:30S ribosomal protein S31